MGLLGDADQLTIAADESNLGSGSHITFRVDASEAMRIGADGNVGIGTVPSAWSSSTALQLGDRVSLASVGTTSDLHLTNNAYWSSPNWRAEETAEASNYYMTGGEHVWRYAASTTAGNIVSWSEAMRIDSSGNLLVGTTTSVSTSSSQTGAEIRSNGISVSAVNSNACTIANRIGTDGDITLFRKDGTTVGSIGNAGSNLHIGSGDVGIRFAGGADALVPVGASSNLGTKRDGSIDIGESSGRFKDIYATNGTIQTSDRNEKQDIESLSDVEQRVAVAAKGLLRKFRWKSAVEEKGDDARIHFGIIAQDLQAAFTAEGLDAGRYGMFIHSTWTDEETGEERSRMGVRYSELLAFIIAAI